MKSITSSADKCIPATGLKESPGSIPNVINRRSIKSLAIIILAVCSQFIVNSQPIYFNTQQGIFQLTDGNRNVINTGCGPDSNILSIAVYKDTIYYSTWAGELKRFKIGAPGTCETLIESGFSYTSMTVDKNGIIYMATELLARYDPHTRQLTELGRMPFFSAGDMLFFKDKLLMSGWDPHDWSSGIFEIIPDDLSSSKLYMASPAFIGLAANPVPCGNSRYFGLSVEGSDTKMTELDLANKTVTAFSSILPGKILDAASITESGIDNKVVIAAISKTNPGNCPNAGGSIDISASSLNAPLVYTLLNTGISQPSGKFTNLRGGLYRLRISDAAGCSKDTSIAITEDMTAGRCNDIFIPDAFTPNNDGKNDYFSISVPPGFKEINLQVYGRWGNMVYAAKGNNISWDGDSKGTKQPAGVYIYTFSYTSATGERKILKGTLTLIR